MVTSAVDVLVFVEVDEIDEKLLAHCAYEAGRMPAHTVPRSLRVHRHLAALQEVIALVAREGEAGQGGEVSESATTQRLAFASLTEVTQLFLFFI